MPALHRQLYRHKLFLQFFIHIDDVPGEDRDIAPKDDMGWKPNKRVRFAVLRKITHKSSGGSRVRCGACTARVAANPCSFSAWSRVNSSPRKAASHQLRLVSRSYATRIRCHGFQFAPPMSFGLVSRAGHCYNPLAVFTLYPIEQSLLSLLNRVYIGMRS